MRGRTSDLLMWVGADHYPTVELFLREAEQMGVSKGVAQVPAGTVLEKSLLFLAHDEAARMVCGACRGRGVKRGRLVIELVERQGRKWVPVEPVERREVATAAKFRAVKDKTYAESGRARTWQPAAGQGRCEKCAGRGEVPVGRIFGVCRIDRLELVFDCLAAAKEYKDRREACGRRDPVRVTYVVGGVDDGRRLAGYRRIGGLYLTTSQDSLPAMQELAGKLGPKFKTRGPIVVFPTPVAYHGGRFRGAKVVEGAELLKKVRVSGDRKRKRKAKRVTKHRPTHPRGNSRARSQGKGHAAAGAHRARRR